MPLPARLPVRKLDSAEVCELAILIRAGCANIPKAKGRIAMFELQVSHGFRDCAELRVLLETFHNFTVRSPDPAELRRAYIQDLFVKSLEGGEVGPSTQCNGVAENLLRACEPCGA